MGALRTCIKDYKERLNENLRAKLWFTYIDMVDIACTLKKAQITGLGSFILKQFPNVYSILYQLLITYTQSRLTCISSP